MIKKYILTFFVATLCCSCSFKSASGAATQELMDRGAFPGEVPAWVAQSNLRNPERSNLSNPIAGVSRRTTSQNVLSRRYEAEKEEKQKALKPKQEEKKSPLDRIIEVCPRIETEISKALVTTDPETRLAKYEALTKRCAISADLWVWLGSDYLATGDRDKARFCANRAFSLEPRSEEAMELLNKVGGRK